jgi:hypothetical protein
MKIPHKITTATTALGNPVFLVEVRNDSPDKHFATLAVSEGQRSERDLDTYFRDTPIAPGTSRSFEIPRGGNGADAGANYRLTVKAACGRVLGVELGVLVGQGCSRGAGLDAGGAVVATPSAASAPAGPAIAAGAKPSPSPERTFESVADVETALREDAGFREKMIQTAFGELPELGWGVVSVKKTDRPRKGMESFGFYINVKGAWVETRRPSDGVEEKRHVEGEAQVLIDKTGVPMIERVYGGYNYVAEPYQDFSPPAYWALENAARSAERIHGGRSPRTGLFAGDFVGGWRRVY